MTAAETIDALLKEGRTFPPPREFRKHANIADAKVYARAAKNPEKFWEGFAKELFWFKRWKKVCDWKPPFAKWFVGGQTNLCYNCVDRHLAGPRRNKAAIIWEGEPGDTRVLTYWDLYREVCRFAGALKSLGVKRGDRVTLYLPMIPELAIAMLACARIGAAHSVVFGGFSAEALQGRINDSQSKVVVTADGGYRRGQLVPLKKNTDDALANTPGVEKAIVIRRTGQPVDMKAGRDVWYHELKAEPFSGCERMDSEDLLYILYTSGTTGKPKGIVHTTGGMMVGVYATTQWVFDLKEDDTYWCTADIGWVTGHSYVVYGPLANGASVVMYEGAPDWPDRDRFWALVEKYGVTVFYTAPTAIRAFMKWGEDLPSRHDLSSLRLLGSVGEPINPEAWMWYHRVIGGSRCPIVDTWWQTETGHILITPLPGLTKLKPGSATRPFPGIDADVWDETGKPVPPGKGGFLVIKKPWPGMLRGIFGDEQRYVKQYWSNYKNVYFAGDGCRKDKDGCLWLLGRVDDVLKVAGHRLSTMELESALVDHPAVAEAAVIGKHHEIKENAIVAFVTLKQGHDGGDSMEQSLKEHVVKKIGSIARPDQIILTPELPKTRSGKIM
ncbi:MAG TPA: acetate--CoA ligase, partial [Planctomycetota bacterium]|nr:acetate--CoA ligase [Planctomycetota bacterium]